MTYDTSERVLDCGSCGTPIPAGMPIYRVTSARLPRCSACVARMGLSVLSASEANRVRETADPAGFTRLRRLAMPKELRGRLVDWKQKQAGSATDG